MASLTAFLLSSPCSPKSACLKKSKRSLKLRSRKKLSLSSKRKARKAAMPSLKRRAEMLNPRKEAKEVLQPPLLRRPLLHLRSLMYSPSAISVLARSLSVRLTRALTNSTSRRLTWVSLMAKCAPFSPACSSSSAWKI